MHGIVFRSPWVGAALTAADRRLLYRVPVGYIVELYGGSTRGPWSGHVRRLNGNGSMGSDEVARYKARELSSVVTWAVTRAELDREVFDAEDR